MSLLTRLLLPDSLIRIMGETPARIADPLFVTGEEIPAARTALVRRFPFPFKLGPFTASAF